MVIIRKGKENVRVRKVSSCKLKKGDVVSIRTGGGGGWGDPLKRDPSLILSDVRNGFMTARVAEREYRVVVDASSWKVESTRRGGRRRGSRRKYARAPYQEFDN